MLIFGALKAISRSKLNQYLIFNDAMFERVEQESTMIIFKNSSPSLRFLTFRSNQIITNGRCSYDQTGI